MPRLIHKMADKFIIALDQGTTSSRALLINKQTEVVGIAQREFEQIFPKPGWVEHNPLEILETQMDVFGQLLKDHNIDPSQIATIGITNQRETTVLWNRKTGKPVYNAIVWQDKRTANLCEELKKEGLQEYVQKTTGLIIDSYFSATKIKWVLDHVKEARDAESKGELLFGTIDTWLLWNLTKGEVHATDYSNASRTMLFDIHLLQWDEKLLDQLKIPKSILPDFLPSSGHFGNYMLNSTKIPISGIAGDQQAALFGQACFEAGMAKNTYGTGCFMLMNTGETPQRSRNGLLTTIAWGINNKVFYALEGSVFIAGAAIQWLRDELKIINTASESEEIANSLIDENPVYVVPAFAGLGAPYWDMYARGAIFGLTRDTGKKHITKATLDSLAYQTKDILEAMQNDSGTKLTSLSVDGGASANNYLMQFQADILNVEVVRPQTLELTALGAAYLAGIAVGYWKYEDLLNKTSGKMVFKPKMDNQTRELLYKGWLRAVKRSMDWDN